ncbi:MAG: bifunctional 3-deoxy-7-phosphoheptulonate synthase/chorismate mutase [Bacilli bacterium]
MSEVQLETLRNQLDDVNIRILGLLNERAGIVQEIGRLKEEQGVQKFDPERESNMLAKIATLNEGPLTTPTVQHLFKEIFKAGLDLQQDDHKKTLLVSRKKKSEDTVIEVNGAAIGAGRAEFIVGPCAVESYEQVSAVGKIAAEQGIRILRGGAFKPRTSPYDFQGLGVEGLQILQRVAKENGLAVISEIVDPKHIEVAGEYIDIIQIGARNMQNFELLKEAGRSHKPVLLKRGLAATIEEFIHAAEYIISQGNANIMLCERGIRTYERATRNTLDISAVPILKKETHLPVFVDVTHSTGRKDLLVPTAKAALAIGADGIMAEVHPNPAVALSDAQQQMDFPTFEKFMSELTAFQNRL